MTIQFWRGNPRNVKSNPYQFGTGVVEKVLLIEIFPNKDMVRLSFDRNIFATITSAHKLNQLAVNDGFKDWEEMKEWFTEDFTGKLVIWKDLEAIK